MTRFVTVFLFLEAPLRDSYVDQVAMYTMFYKKINQNNDNYSGYEGFYKTNFHFKQKMAKMNLLTSVFSTKGLIIRLQPLFFEKRLLAVCLIELF